MRCNPEAFAVSKFSRDKNLIQFDPVYQREGGVWSKAKKQLFIDSLLNGYDIPKIYMHRLSRDESGYDYAVIDGKQRITTIFSFIDGEFDLDSDFAYSGAPLDVPPKAGDRYQDLSESARDVFKEVQLNVVVVETKDVEEIEELFSRLNNGEKLNAAESRNAIGGSMAALVRDAAKLDFFTKKLKFPNTRYAHYEVACKLLYLEMQAMKSPNTLVVVDLKKKFLDEFVRQYKGINDAESKRLLERLTTSLKQISPIFDDGDIELSKQSYPQLMYLFGKDIIRQYGAPDLKANLKTFLKDFRLERVANLDKDEDSRDAELSEYGRLMQQGTNDTNSMKQRIEILTKRFLRAYPSVELKDTKRGFTLEERWVLWQRSGKRCEECKTELATLEELDGDHIVWHMDGGPTSLENARALCIPCNRGHVGKHEEASA